MNIDITIQVKDDKVQVKSNRADPLEMVNLVAIESTENKIIEVGKTLEEIAQYNPENWEKGKSSIVLEKGYDPENFNPDTTQWLIWACISRILAHRFFAPYFDKIECKISLPFYEVTDRKKREFFEFAVSERTNLERLIINNIEIEWLKHRKLAKALLEVPIIGSYLIGFFLGFKLSQISPMEAVFGKLTTIIGALSGFLGIFIVYSLICIIWLVLARKFLHPAIAYGTYFSTINDSHLLNRIPLWFGKFALKKQKNWSGF